MTGPQMVVSQAQSIWRRLGTRLALFTGRPAGFAMSVSTVVQAVVDVDSLLKTPKTGTVTLDLSPLVGSIVLAFTVPTAKRWNLKHFFVEGLSATGRFKYDTGDGAYRNLTETKTAEIARVVDVVLDQGGRLGHETTGNAGDASRSIQIHYLEEDAY